MKERFEGLYLLVFFADGGVYFIDKLLLLSYFGDIFMVSLQFEEERQILTTFFH